MYVFINYCYGRVLFLRAPAQNIQYGFLLFLPGQKQIDKITNAYQFHNAYPLLCQWVNPISSSFRIYIGGGH